MATVIRVDGTRAKLADTELATLQLAVGGYIEVLYLPAKMVLIINEDGISLDLPINPVATSLCVGLVYMAGGIRGDAVLCEASELRKDDE